MSFNGNVNGKAYEPGWFLANNEDCTRETREMSQANAVTGENGGKYVPMGSAYPSNDANAIGIVYEDVDVTNGNMPGSVVTKGEVYSDRLAVTGVSYNAASPVGTENPSEEGWYERSGSSPNYVYTLTKDTTVNDQKTYYVRTVSRLSATATSTLQTVGFKFKTAPAVTR